MPGEPVKLGAADPVQPVEGIAPAMPRSSDLETVSGRDWLEFRGPLARARFSDARACAPGARFKFLSILPDKLQKRLSARAGFSNNA